MRKSQKPTVTYSATPHQGSTISTHPAFGLIEVTHQTKCSMY